MAERGEARPEARRGEARQLWGYLGRGRQAAAGRRMIAQRACAVCNGQCESLRGVCVEGSAYIYSLTERENTGATPAQHIHNTHQQRVVQTSNTTPHHSLSLTSATLCTRVLSSRSLFEFRQPPRSRRFGFRRDRRRVGSETCGNKSVFLFAHSHARISHARGCRVCACAPCVKMQILYNTSKPITTRDTAWCPRDVGQ